VSLSLSLSLSHTHTRARARLLEHDCVRSLYAVLRNSEKSTVARAFENTLSGSGRMAIWRRATWEKTITSSEDRESECAERIPTLYPLE